MADNSEDREIRVSALSFALMGNESSATDVVVKRAKEFYRFLNAGDATPPATGGTTTPS